MKKKFNNHSNKIHNNFTQFSYNSNIKIEEYFFLTIINHFVSDAASLHIRVSGVGSTKAACPDRYAASRSV